MPGSSRIAVVFRRTIVALGAVLFWFAPAAASERVNGLALAVVRNKGEAVVRPEAVAGMPRAVKPLADGDVLPNGAFVDQRGRAFRFADFRGQDVVLAFIYTRCQDRDMCPLISAKFRELQERLRDARTHLVEMTLDPQYDSPAVLARYARTFGADPKRWTLGTGDPGAVLDFAAKFGINPFPAARIGLIHTERTALIGADGRVFELIDEAGWSPSQVVAELRARHNLSSNPIARWDLVLSRTAVAICGNRVAGYSGFLDLAVLLAIVSIFGWTLFRVGRGIFAG